MAAAHAASGHTYLAAPQEGEHQVQIPLVEQKLRCRELQLEPLDVIEERVGGVLIVSPRDLTERVGVRVQKVEHDIAKGHCQVRVVIQRGKLRP